MNRYITFATVVWLAVGLRLGITEMRSAKEPENLRRPFAEMPMQILGADWQGEDVPFDEKPERHEEIRRKTGVTDFINRRYRKDGKQLWLYVGFVSGWKPGSIHHPGVCFPSTGLRLEEPCSPVTLDTSHSDSDLDSETKTNAAPAAFLQYLWKRDLGDHMYTLTSFYYDGKYQPDEWRLRLDGFFGIRSFAIITLSGSYVGSREATQKFYAESMKSVIRHLKDHLP